jgi:hypothetical protein
VKLLLTNRSLEVRGGSESYLETVAVELAQLGHEVEIYSPRRGVDLENRLRGKGLPVHHTIDALARDYDVAHVQYASTAYELRGARPELPIVFACHARALDNQDAPWLAAPAALVAFNDRVLSRLEANRLSETVPVYRLRQPVHTEVNEPGRVLIHQRPRRAMVISRRFALQEQRLRRACDALDIELAVFRPGLSEDEVRGEMMRSDVVFGSGRTVLDAMALGRAAFVLDEEGSWTWVSHQNYEVMEGLGFVPTSDHAPRDVPDLIDEVARYDPELGRHGYELTAQYHSARVHAGELIDVYRPAAAVAPSRPPGIGELFAALAPLADRLDENRNELRAAQWEAAQFHGAWQDTEDLLRRTARDRDHQFELVRALQGSLSWRLTAPLRRLKARTAGK